MTIDQMRAELRRVARQMIHERVDSTIIDGDEIRMFIVDDSLFCASVIIGTDVTNADTFNIPAIVDHLKRRMY